MSARLRTWAIILGGLLLVGGGFLFLRGPKPVIEIKAETLWTVGFLDITNTLFTSWFVVLFLIAIAFLSTRRLSIVPSGLQNVMEAVIEALYNLVVNTAGERNGRRFFPVIATIFLLVIVANWFALLPVFNAFGKIEEVSAHHFREEAIVFDGSLILPGAEEVEIEFDEASCAGTTGDAQEECLELGREHAIDEALIMKGLDPDTTRLGVIAPYFRSVNTDLMSTLSLAIVSAIFVEYWGISTLGLVAYGGKFFNISRLRRGNLMGLMDLFVGVLEFIAEIARIISFTFRLFGNMLAGEILLLVMTFLIPLLLALPFYGLELFVGAIQAFVFAMLTLIFAVLAVSGHGEEHAEERRGEEVASVRQA